MHGDSQGGVAGVVSEAANVGGSEGRKRGDKSGRPSTIPSARRTALKHRSFFFPLVQPTGAEV
jgi:hypothetical protein